MENLQKPDQDQIEVEIHLTDDLLEEIKEKEKNSEKFKEITLGNKVYFSAAAIGFFSIIFCIVTFYSPLRPWIEEIFLLHSEIKVRDYFDPQESVNPKIKAVIFDDNSFSRMQRSHLSLVQWARLLRKIDRQKPKAIVVDKIFGTLSDYEGRKEIALKAIRKIKTPILTGSFVTTVKLPGRPILKAESIDKGQESVFSIEGKPENSLRDARHLYAHGAHQEFISKFFPGHIVINSSRELDAGFLLKGGYTLPHLALRIADRIQFFENSSRLRINNDELNHRNGRFLVNFKPPNLFFKNAKGIDRVLKYSKKRMDKFIQEGDYVVILPTFYTGSGDFKKTPYGVINGGFYLLYTIDSILGGGWLKYFEWDFLISALMAIFGASLLIIGSGYFLIFAVLFPFLTFAVAMYLFVGMNLVTNWYIWILVYIITGLMALIVRRTLDRNRQIHYSMQMAEAKIVARENLLLEAKKNVLLKEKKEAAFIASSLQPKPVPEAWKEILVRSYHRCFDAASGDWFYFHKLPDSELYHVGLFDITGHGVQAAIVVSSCKSALTSIFKTNPEWATRIDFHDKIAEHINRVLWEQGKGDHMTTYCGITVNPKQRKYYALTCANPYPLVINWETGKTRFLRQSNNPVGFTNAPLEKSVEFDFDPNEQLYIYSDGLPLKANLRMVKKMLTKEHQEKYQDNLGVFVDKFWTRLQEKGKEMDDDISSITLRLGD